MIRQSFDQNGDIQSAQGECDNCGKIFSLKGYSLNGYFFVKNEMKKTGWKIGDRDYCPDCIKLLNK